MTLANLLAEPGLANAAVVTFGTVIVALITKGRQKTRQAITEISDSVNHRHERGDGRGIFDHVLDISEKIGHIKAGVEEIKDAQTTTHEQLEALQQKTLQNTSRILLLEQRLTPPAPTTPPPVPSTTP